MLGAFVVAIGIVQPAMLERVPITPGLIIGRWERVYTSAPVKPDFTGYCNFRKDGSYYCELRDLRTGKVKSSCGGTYTLGDRRLTIVITTPDNEGRGTADIKLLRGGRMLLTELDGGPISVIAKMAD